MSYIAANNAVSTLAANLGGGALDLTLIIQLADVALFPTINHGGSGSDYTLITLEDAAGNIEIVMVTRHDTGATSMTIVRAQEGTTRRAWLIGDAVGCRMTAALVTATFAHPDDTSDAHAASSIGFTPAGALAATNVQAALVELDAEKQPIDPDLTAFAALGASPDMLIQRDNGGVLSLTAITSFSRTLIARATAALMRQDLGLGDGNSVNTANNAVVLDGSGRLPAVDGSQLTGLAGTPTGTVLWFAMNSAPSGYLKANGAAISRSTYASLFAALVKSSTVTMTIASPGVITWTAHGLSANDPVKFSTTGALPTGFTAGTTYYVVSASITTNTFQLSATAGGSAINTTGSQSGVHTAINAPHGNGDGSTTFNIPDLRGEFPRGWDDSRGVDSNRSFGSAQSSQNLAHTHTSQIYDGGGTTGGTGFARNGTGDNMASSDASSSSGGAEARPRNIALLACIKY